MNATNAIFISWSLSGVLGMAYVSFKLDKYCKIPWSEIIARHLISSVGPLYPLYWYTVYRTVKKSPFAYLLLVDSEFGERPKTVWIWSKK